MSNYDGVPGGASALVAASAIVHEYNLRSKKRKADTTLKAAREKMRRLTPRYAMKKSRGKRRTRRSFKGTGSSAVVVNKYNPSKTMKGRSGGKKRGVSKKFYGKVMKAMHGDHKQVFRLTWPSTLSDVSWLAYVEASATLGQATNIMGIATGLSTAGNIAAPTITNQFNSILFQIFRDMGTQTIFTGTPTNPPTAPTNPEQQGYGESSIFLKSINIDVTIFNNQPAAIGSTVDVDIIEFLCKRDIPRNQTISTQSVNGSNVMSLRTYNEVIQIYEDYMTKTGPARGGSITANMNTSFTNLVLPFNNRMAQFTTTTLGTQPFHNPEWCSYMKIGKKTKIFLAPGENARLQFNYKVNKKVYAKNVFSNICLKGVTKALGFIVNNVDRSGSTVTPGFAYKATHQYNYIDTQQRTDTKQIYIPS